MERVDKDVEESVDEPAMDLELDILDDEDAIPTLHRRQSGSADEVQTLVISYFHQ